MWAYSNFDRIVAETVKKHKEEMKEEKEKAKREAFANSTYGRLIAQTKEFSNSYIKQMIEDRNFDTQWDAKDVKVGSVLKIRMPSTI